MSLAVVLCELLRSVFRAISRVLLDPSRHGAMPNRALVPGDLRVRHVTDERMPERVLVLALDGGGPGEPHPQPEPLGHARTPLTERLTSW